MDIRRTVRRWLRKDRLASLVWPNHPTRWDDVPGRLRPRLTLVLRLTMAATLTFLITAWITRGEFDLTGPLTALLVMQASAYSTIKMGVVRVGAVLGGVMIASVLSTWVGLTWWSLAAVVAASLLLGAALRLGDQLIETPISAMLILGVTNPNVAAETRVLNTLIGAAVGVGFNLVYPPAMQTRSVRQAVADSADAAAAPLTAAATAFRAGPLQRAQVVAWMDLARAADARLVDAQRMVAAFAGSRRLNTRAIGTTDVAPVLASGLRTLEGGVLGVRALLATLEAELPETLDLPTDPYGARLRAAFAVVFDDTADALRGFGALVVAEAEEREGEPERRLAETLKTLATDTAALTEMIIADAQHDQQTWLLRGSVLAALDHVVDQLDLDERARVRRAWKADQALRPMAHLPLIVQAALPHPDRPMLRGLPPGTLPSLPSLPPLPSFGNLARHSLPAMWPPPREMPQNLPQNPPQNLPRNLADDPPDLPAAPEPGSRDPADREPEPGSGGSGDDRSGTARS